MGWFAMKLAVALSLLLVFISTSLPAMALGICVEGSYPPFGFVAPDGTVQGFNTDIATAVCAQMDVSCEMVRTEWEEIIPALLAGRCDAIIASMAPTAARREVVDFTSNYYISPSTFVARADPGFGPTAEDMRGRTVGVQRATAHQELMERNYPGTNLKLYATPDEAYRDLAAGRLDAVLGGRISILTGFLGTPAGEGYALIGEATPGNDSAGASFAVRKEDVALRDRLSAAIAALHASGRYQELSQRYFGTDIYE
jgi:ABC-type amino acid transport substrate-binding protein